MLSARALPPLRPRATAAGFFFLLGIAVGLYVPLCTSQVALQRDLDVLDVAIEVPHVKEPWGSFAVTWDIRKLALLNEVADFPG